MRIAVVHPYPVHRRALGGVTRIHLLVQHLAPRHEVTVLAHATGNSQADDEAIRELSEIGITQKLFERPEPRLGRKAAWLIDREPYFVARNRNAKLAAALAELDLVNGVDVVHTEFAYMAPALQALGNRPLRVLAEQETQSLAIERLREIPLRKKKLYECFIGTQLEKVRRFERRVIPSFDLIYAITPQERDLMQERAGKRVAVLPHVVCTRTYSVPAHENVEPAVMFVGNYLHRPNFHGLCWFLERVWPRVRKRAPGAYFDVVGPGLSDRHRLRMSSPGVRILGRVEDLVKQYQSSKVLVNPIFSGAGMRGKVLEAFACGRAVVSTRMGMEGIEAVQDRHFLLADDPESFAEAVAAYLEQEGLRREHGRAGRELVENLYGASTVFARLEQDYQRAAAERRASPLGS
jgi:polysaccharide biosynthesis protein PslH